MTTLCPATTLLDGLHRVACQLDESIPHEWHEAVVGIDTNVSWKES